jgi:7-cyano-7-deazaguanine reductase
MTIAENRTKRSRKPGRIVVFENKNALRDFRVRLDFDELPSLDPVTGKRASAKVRIEYVPDKTCVEINSLRAFLSSFPADSSLDDRVAHRILEHLVSACSPRRASVHGEYSGPDGLICSVDAFYPFSESAPLEPARKQKENE